MGLFDADYFWVVICKNRRFHRRQNISYEHRIPLAETDAYSPLPNLREKISVCCDNCGEEFSYNPNEVMRAELKMPERFVPHPMFQ